MPDPVVSKLKVEGKTSLWRNAEGRGNEWNLACDSRAAGSLIALLDLMEEAHFPSRKTIEISRDSRLRLAPGLPRPVKVAETMEIRYSSTNPPDYWQVDHSHGDVVLLLGSNMLGAFRQGLRDIIHGRGDYSIGEPSLWFWWVVGD